MAVSVRIANSPNRRMFQKSLLYGNPVYAPSRNIQPICSSPKFSSLTLHPKIPALFKSLASNRFTFSSPSRFPTAHFAFTDKRFASVFWGHKENGFRWNFAFVEKGTDGVDVVHEKGPEVAVVLLGWLGAKTKHLRRYVEFYTARGMHAVTFVASVSDVLSFDLGRKLEERIERLSHELASWLSNNDGRERFLIFHTFSNTGWLAYGAILQNLKDKKDLLERIKGCVVDSGGDPNIDPKVWAAGFSTALLKKSSSATHLSIGEGKELTIEMKGTNLEEKKPFLLEILLLSAFEKLFSYLLHLPDVRRRLTKIISGLSKNQPSCPQLYLYSAGDRVIPFQAIKSFIEDQRRCGKQVFSFDFGSSPHVDHYRTFPDLYVLQLDYFLKECGLVLVYR